MAHGSYLVFAGLALAVLLTAGCSHQAAAPPAPMTSPPISASATPPAVQQAKAAQINGLRQAARQRAEAMQRAMHH